ncbi:site-specific integrase [Isosphaeraceae bacterium EP7]
MAYLGKKGDTFVARFRHGGKEYKKSLKTTDAADARVAIKGLERAIHGLLTGLIEVPPGVDPGDFIVSGGTLRAPARSRRRAPTLAALAASYLQGQSHKAPSTVYTEGVHLRNLMRALGPKAEASADAIAHRDLDQFLQARLKLRWPSTVHKERDTVGQLFAWAVANGYLESSPASDLAPIKEHAELPRFRTIAEIERMQSRGGLSAAESAGLWDCLYLAPGEIGGLLRSVNERAEADFAHLLHAIPAYTGMRRGEVLRLRWEDVELDRRQVVARSLKQSRRTVSTARRIDLHPELRRILDEWSRKRPGGQHVVCEPGSPDALGTDRANRAFWQPMRGTGWCLDSKRNWFKVGFHTYRHSFASNLASRGVDQRIIDEWMGHQTEGMRKRYRHLHPDDRRSAIESLSFGDEPSEGAS